MKNFNKILIIAFVLLLSCTFLSAPSASAVIPTHYTGLVKADFDAVYYVIDHYRFTYPQDKYFFTWREDFSEVTQVSNEELANIPMVNNILVRPGTKFVKIQSIPTVYAVGRDGMLYPIVSEGVAEQMFGENWSNNVIDIQDSFWFNYIDTRIELDGNWYPDGFLLKTADSDDIYIIWEDEKRLFTSSHAFEINRFNHDYVYTTSQVILDSYGNGPDIIGIEDDFTIDSQSAEIPSTQ